MLGAADNHVGLQALFQHRLHRVLGGLGLELARRRQIGHIGEVYHHHVFRAFPRKLTHGLDIGQGFDVAHSATYFGDYHIKFTTFGQEFDAAFDFVGDMGNHLHGAAEIVAAPFLFDNRLIDTPRCDVIGLGGGDVGEAFVVSQVEVCFGAVFGYVAFAVFVRIERTRVYVDVGVEFLNGGLVAAREQQTRQRRGYDAFSQRRGHSAGNEDEFCGMLVHGFILFRATKIRVSPRKRKKNTTARTFRCGLCRRR